MLIDVTSDGQITAAATGQNAHAYFIMKDGSTVRIAEVDGQIIRWKLAGQCVDPQCPIHFHGTAPYCMFLRSFFGDD